MLDITGPLLAEVKAFWLNIEQQPKMEGSILSWDQVPSEMRELYILTGYRPPCTGFLRGVRSAFSLHNETLNVWTHMLPLLYFMYFLIFDEDLLRNLHSLDCNQRYPLYGYILGICILFATSSFAHLMSCAWSRCWRNVCFVLDYAAITMFGVSSAIVYTYLVRLEDGSCSYLFLAIVTSSAVVAMWICCWSRLNAHPLSHVIRTLAFGLPSVFGSMPAFYRYLNSYSNSTLNLPMQPNVSYSDMFEMTSSDVIYKDPDLFYQDRYPRHFVLLIGGAAIKALKVPERWRPGVFDIVGHSHQLFHVFIFLGIREQFWLLLEDILHADSQRRLSNTLPETAPAVMTFVVMASLIAANAVIINWFAQSLTEQHHITAQEMLWFKNLQQQHQEKQEQQKQQQNGVTDVINEEHVGQADNEHCPSKEHGD